MVNPLLSFLIKRSKKRLLAYKNSPEGQKELRPDPEEYIKGKFSAEQKKDFNERPEYLKFLALNKTPLLAMVTKHRALLAQKKRIEVEFAKKDGQKVIYTKVGDNFLLHYKNPKIEKQFLRDVEKQMKEGINTEPDKLRTPSLALKYGHLKQKLGMKGDDKYADGVVNEFNDKILTPAKLVVIKKNPKKYPREETIKKLMENRGRLVAPAPTDVKSLPSRMDRSAAGAGITQRNIEDLARVKRGKNLQTGHLGPKGFIDDANPERTLDDFGFQPTEFNQRMIRPAEEVRNEISQAQKDTLKSVLKHYTKDNKVMFGGGFKPGVSDADILTARQKIHNLNNDLDVLNIASGGQVRGVYIDPLTFEATALVGGPQARGSMTQATGLAPLKVRSLTKGETEDITARMEESIDPLTKDTRGFINDIKTLLRNPTYVQRLKTTEGRKLPGTYTYDDMIKALDDEALDEFTKQTSIDDFSELPGFDYEVGTKDYGFKKGGSVKKEYPSISLVKEEDSNLNYIKRNKFSEGGLIATRPERQSFSIDELKSNNKIGVLESMLAGVGSGLIQIPKGAFSLGASLLDLGFGTNNAAKVEKYFDDLTDLDEKAEKTFLGNMTQLLVNLGVPGGAAFKIGSGLTKKALLAKKNGNYFKMTDPKLIEKFGTTLDTKGRIFATMGGGGAVAVSDMIFAGDVEDIGTLGDMFGGPTELLPNDSDNAAREVMNRIKFGVDGALLLGALGATGSALKTAIKRRDELGSNNEKIDYFLSAFRPRGRKTEEFFGLERENIGLRQGDVNYASEVSRKLDKHIDAIFPYVKSPFNKMGNDGRRDFMKELNDTLLSGDIGRDAKGDIRFGPMSPERVGKITRMMRDKGAKQEDIDGVIDSFEMMRGGWGHMFTRLGKTMDDAGKTEFAELFSNKFRDYLGSTYEIFRNKSLIPLFNYKPSEQAVEKAIKMFQDSAELGGKGRLSREQAEYYVNRLVETARPAREIATKAEKTSGIYFNAPDFFLNKTTLSDIEKIGDGILPLDEVMKAERQIIEEVLGKVEDPLQTVLNGTNRLSMVTRRRQFYNTLVKEDADLELKRLRFVENNPGVAIPKEMRGFFRDTELEAVNAFGANVKKIEIDPGRTIEAGITDSLNGKYAPKGVAEAIEESAMVARDKSTLTQLYENFVLYPKATSQLAKTVLSPITHVRNFLSASAFTTANGLIPGLTVSFDDTANAFKEAYRQLQIPGARQANDRYRELLRLGVVNNNVRLGDLQRLLNDVNFGETFSSTKALRDLMRPFSKGKKVLEDFYTAEDDFWKMTTFALERNRIKTARAKYGMDISEDVLDRAAADLVKNNVPNYDMVSEFIKGIRRVPFGNFVSFPAEIIRTSMNILDTAKREIFTPHTLDDGRVVYPFRDIGLKRLFGFTTTAVGVPTALTAGFSALYDVTEEELDALRRFVPDWSKNSTLIPIRGEDGKLKYIDFSHTNAYDTVVRPFRTMIKGVRDGLEEGELTKNVIRSMIEATTETASPFIGESIWFEGMTDIFIRNGRTREGRRLWTDQTPLGDQMLAGIKHLGATQLPGSLPAFERLYQAATDTPDEYGREFEIPDEALGLFGFRAIEVDPVTAMKFKIADFSTGIRNARREFTGPLLRGGEISPEQVVDQFQIANNALYNVQNKMFKDYYAGRLLGATERQLDNEFADRVSNISLRFLKAGRFRPFVPSENIEQAFRDNALAIGRPNAYLQSREFLRSLIARYNNLPLGGSLPVIENPFRQILGEGITSQMSETTPQGLKVNLTNPVVPRTGSTQTNMNQTAEKGRNVFGATDPIFGS